MFQPPVLEHTMPAYNKPIDFYKQYSSLLPQGLLAGFLNHATISHLTSSTKHPFKQVLCTMYPRKGMWGHFLCHQLNRAQSEKWALRWKETPKEDWLKVKSTAAVNHKVRRERDKDTLTHTHRPRLIPSWDSSIMETVEYTEKKIS